MAKSRVYVSFDYDHDESLKHLLVGQAKHSDSPFELADWSIKETISEDWRKKARTRIRSVDVVAVLCGQHTHTATGYLLTLLIGAAIAVAAILTAHSPGSTRAM